MVREILGVPRETSVSIGQSELGASVDEHAARYAREVVAGGAVGAKARWQYLARCQNFLDDDVGRGIRRMRAGQAFVQALIELPQVSDRVEQPVDVVQTDPGDRAGLDQCE